MDFIVHWGVVIFALTFLQTFFISYDIACQWSVNFIERLKAMNVTSPFLQPGVDIRYVVPKFHLPAHISACQTKFAFMFNWGCGLGDGEAPERGWGESGALAPATRKMGPGSRRDVLDFNWGDYNWRKIVDLGASCMKHVLCSRLAGRSMTGSSLMKKMETATSRVAEHVIALQELETTLDPTNLDAWRKEMAAWERDPTGKSPFVMLVEGPKQFAVRKALAEEEAQAIAAKKDFSLTNDISPSVLVSRGIDLESEQYVVISVSLDIEVWLMLRCRRALKAELQKTWTHSRDRELTRLQLRSNALVRKVEAWYTVLQLYIPATFKLRQDAVSEKTIQPYDLPLWLPSGIGTKAPMDRRLVEIEYKLRTAQVSESLVNLRRQLQRRVTAWDAKRRWVRGQGANTRANNLISTIEDRISADKEEYRRARRALLSLAEILGVKDVEKNFRPLLDADVQSLTRPELEQVSSGQTTRVLSWIWRHSSVAEDDHSAFQAESKTVLLT